MFGQAFVDCFDDSLAVLKQQTGDENQAVRRSLRVSVHFFAKRKPNEIKSLKKLLSHLLLPLVEDTRVFVVKGTGWGLKTTGRYQPKVVVEFLEDVLVTKKISKLMVQKATKYLDSEIKHKMFELWKSGMHKAKIKTL